MNAAIRNAATFLALTLGLACASAPETQPEQDSLQLEAEATLDQMNAKDPSLRQVLSDSAGYAVFPKIGEGAFIAGVTSGVGIVYDAAGNPMGNVEMRGGSVGAQIGGQTYSQIIIFQTRAALTDFQRDDFEFSTDASATALDQGASARLSFEAGVAVVVDNENGLMAEASLDGQKYDYQAI